MTSLGCARVRSASGPRPFLQNLSCVPRPVRVRYRSPQGSQDTGASVARAWRGHDAGYRTCFFLAWVARACMACDGGGGGRPAAPRTRPPKDFPASGALFFLHRCSE
eukprot:gene17378-biopygen21876